MLTVGLVMIALLSGFAVGRGRTPRFDMACLPDPRDERWMISTESCGVHRIVHNQLRLGDILVEEDCGVSVGQNFYPGRAMRRYAGTVVRAQGEIKALAAWGGE